MRKTISRLHDDKSDGDGELWSNHVIYAPESLSIHISMIFTGVITHGYNLIYLLTGTWVSLPKDTSGNIYDSDNYRGICLCSCITKVLEWCIMLRYIDKLATSGLQFSFKSGHSTTMCSLVTRKVVTCFWNSLFRVYAAVIDASKGFDRIRYDRLFGILIKRGLPPIIIRQPWTCMKGRKAELCRIMNMETTLSVSMVPVKVVLYHH